jgi:hypothetical protein
MAPLFANLLACITTPNHKVQRTKKASSHWMNELWGIKLLMKTVKIGLAADRRTLAFRYSVWHQGGGGGQGVMA